MNKMKLKKGDKVVVIAGKDRGKRSTIEETIRESRKIVVAGVNMRKKSQKSRGGVAGKVIEFPAPIDASNVAIIDPEKNKASRLGKKLIAGKRVRISKLSGSEV